MIKRGRIEWYDSMEWLECENYDTYVKVSASISSETEEGKYYGLSLHTYKVTSNLGARRWLQLFWPAALLTSLFLSHSTLRSCPRTQSCDVTMPRQLKNWPVPRENDEGQESQLPLTSLPFELRTPELNSGNDNTTNRQSRRRQFEEVKLTKKTVMTAPIYHIQWSKLGHISSSYRQAGKGFA